MVLADTNILSTFAKIGELPLLTQIEEKDRIVFRDQEQIFVE